MSSTKILTLPLIVVATVGLLAGCQGMAQSQNPVAKKPGTSESADPNTSSCKPASRSTIATLNGLIQTGTKIQLADVAQDGDLWYLAASTSGDEETSSGHISVGIWGAATDPHSSSFSGTLVPVNAAARDAEQGPTPSPSSSASATPTSGPTGFSATSAAAKKARKCMLTDSNLYQ